MISSDEILRIHTAIENKFPTVTESGVKSDGQVSFISSVINGELPIQFDSVFEKSAYICLSLVQSHPFVDGNKRTGLCTMAVFLRKNGYKIQYSEIWVHLLPKMAQESSEEYKSFGKEIQEHSQKEDNKKDASVKSVTAEELERGYEIYEKLASV